MTASHPCSDIAFSPGPRGRADRPGGDARRGQDHRRMRPGSRGLPVLGEYTDDADATIAIAMHPAVDDDDAHQQNWLRKAAQCTARLARDRHGLRRPGLAQLPVLRLLHRGGRRRRPAPPACRLGSPPPRATAACCCRASTSSSTSTPPPASDRRAGRLRPGHPWNQPGALRRLRDFYADPAGHCARSIPGLARALRQPGRADISGLGDPHQISAAWRNWAAGHDQPR